MEISKKYQITGGVYLVIDPSPGSVVLIPKVEAALKGGISVLQIWNHWKPGQDKSSFIKDLCRLSHAYDVPVLIHEDWSWLMNTPLDGVHFDEIPKGWDYLTKFIDRPFLKGITCGNDHARIQWAIDQSLDYISFCSMFPSSSTDVCELVSPEVVKQTRDKTSIPIFVAGGITLENISSLVSLGIDGVALISAIIRADDPEATTLRFKATFNKS
ncbi:MAG TPA: thiamine phosphate synthase [Ohtaekwangia sp.]